MEKYFFLFSLSGERFLNKTCKETIKENLDTFGNVKTKIEVTNIFII